MNKNIFVILGMARSGTSVISRGLKALGIDLGAKLTPGSKWNPKGFWEDNDIVYQVNEKILATLNCRWDMISPITDFSHHALHAIEMRALRLLQQRTEQSNYWGFKDPRTSKLLGFWQPVFRQAQVNEHYIIALRNPLSSAQSFQRLTGTDIEHGLLLWFVHMLSALQDTIDKKRILVSYELMLKQPAEQLARIKRALEIPELAPPNEIEQFVNTFLDKSLYHFDNRLEDLHHHPALTIAPECAELYEQLLTIAEDKADFESSAFLSAYIEAQQACLTQLPYYAYMDKLLGRSQALQLTLRKLHKSRLWRLIYPLRKVDNWLRVRRKQRKAMQLEQNNA